MQREMKLQGRVRLENNGSWTFVTTLYDGSPLEVGVAEYDVQLNEEFSKDVKTVDGFLFVMEEAKQADRCYLTLPKPSMQYGKQVLVRDLQLMPRNVSLNSFSPKTGVVKSS